MQRIGGVHQWKKRQTSDVDDNTTTIQMLIEQKKKTATTIRQFRQEVVAERLHMTARRCRRKEEEDRWWANDRTFRLRFILEFRRITRQPVGSHWLTQSVSPPRFQRPWPHNLQRKVSAKLRPSVVGTSGARPKPPYFSTYNKFP